MEKRIKKIVSQIKAEAENQQDAQKVDRQLEQLWELSKKYKQNPPPHFDTEKNLRQLQAKIATDKQARSSIIRPLLRMAAGLAFLLTLAWLLNNYVFQAKMQTVLNTSDQIESITLSDGTAIDLHPGAQLQYPNRFFRNQAREVVLDGVAFFSVSADPKHPFLIQTSQTQVKVVGTAFLLKADQNIETSIEVEEGTVYFQDKSSQQEIRLSANQVGICQRGGILYQEPLQIEGTLEIKLRNQPLKRLFAQMQRHHNWQFDIGESVKDCRLTGTFDIQQPEKVLRQINEFSNFSVFKKKEGHYQVTGDCQ